MMLITSLTLIRGWMLIFPQFMRMHTCIIQLSERLCCFLFLNELAVAFDTVAHSFFCFLWSATVWYSLRVCFSSFRSHLCSTVCQLCCCLHVSFKVCDSFRVQYTQTFVFRNGCCTWVKVCKIFLTDFLHHDEMFTGTYTR